MPTGDELGKLAGSCHWTFTTRNGVKGYIVKGTGAYDSASIFIPAAGHGSGESLYGVGGDAEHRLWYWSSELALNYNKQSIYLRDQLDGGTWWIFTDGYYRCFGVPIRPVISANE